MLNKHSTKEEILSAFKTYGTQAVMEACPKLLDNKAFMYYAVQIDGLALAYAALALRDNKKIVIAAIKQSQSWAFFYASTRLKEDDLDILWLMDEINPWVSQYYFYFIDEPEFDSEESAHKDYDEYDYNHKSFLIKLISFNEGKLILTIISRVNVIFLRVRALLISLPTLGNIVL